MPVDARLQNRPPTTLADPRRTLSLRDPGRTKPVAGFPLVRGSHLVLDRPCPHAYLLEVPIEPRIAFVLPWQGKSLVGTAEVRQTIDAPVVCEDSERDYLLAVARHYFPRANGPGRVVEAFAGVRPLLRSADNPAQATREYAIHRDGALVSVFGGKWTTACALARKVSDTLQ